jgi:hypothetical protein
MVYSSGGHPATISLCRPSRCWAAILNPDKHILFDPRRNVALRAKGLLGGPERSMIKWM